MPFICRLFNASQRSGCVPQSFKSAYITPLLKQAGLDNSDPKNYRLIPNLLVMSKLLERVILQWLLSISSPTACYPVFSPPTEIPPHWNCAREGIIGYLDGTWPRQRGGTGPSRPVRSVRHSRSSYSASPLKRLTWNRWNGAELDNLVSYRLPRARMSCRSTVWVAVHKIWRAARLGRRTVVICALYRWSRATDRRPSWGRGL